MNSTNFDEEIEKSKQGKELFESIFDINELSINDAFVLVLTKNVCCIKYGIKYLPNFIELYNKRKVFVVLDNEYFLEAFSKVGGNVIVCKTHELRSLASYLDLFRKKEYLETRIIFLTEKDGYGLFVEALLKKNLFSLEEYVAISLYQLEKLI